MLSEKAKSRAQQRFFGMVRAAQKGEMENPSSEVLDAADSMKVDDVKKFAKTKHKGLPEIKEGKKKGLWDNIHAKRKRGEKPAKPGDKDYPKTLNVEGAAWTKKSGKNKEGGLNEKGRKSYERENPGSDLKAPQPEGGSRKKSFCARMGGMKKKLTSAKTANDPDSRINKSLRKWKCNEEKIEEVAFLAGLAKGAAVAAKGAVKGAVKQKAKEVVASKAVNVAAGAIPQPNMSESKGTAELAAIKLRGRKACAVCGSLTHATGQCPKKEHDVNETTMPNVSSKDKKAINARAKNTFKKDLKGEHVGVNEGVGRMIGTVAGTVAKAAKAVNREVLPIKHAKNLEQEVKKGYEASKPKEVKKKINKKRNILQKGIGKVARAVSSKTDKIASTMGEARVDKGRSDYGKATIRNWRHSGPDTVEPAMFDPENKRGKTIDKRREEHKERRGKKGAKVPVHGVKEEKVKNYGKTFSIPLPGALKNIKIDAIGPEKDGTLSKNPIKGTLNRVGLSPTGKENLTNVKANLPKVAKSVGKAALKTAGAVGAGLAVSKGVDSLMKMGKKKKIKEQILDELNLDELKLFGKKGSGAIFYNDPKGRRDALKTTGKDPGVVNKPAVDNAVKNVKTNVTNKVNSVVAPVQKKVQRSIDTQTNRAGANIGNQISTRVKPAVSSGVADGIKQGATAVGKAALKGTAAVGAGLAVSKGVDSVMKGGKKKTNEELSIVDKMLVEYSPNVAYQDKKKGKLGKSSVYSLRGKDESKKDFRKSHVKDIEGGYVGAGHKPTPGNLKKEEVVLEKKKQPSVHDDYYDPMEDPTFDPHEAEATRGQSGKGTKGKMNVRKKYPVKEGVVDVIKKGTKRHKDAVEKKKIKNRKAVPYAALAAGHQPEGEVIDEKKKGLDGKECWDGYKLAGTKKKGGKTVDNCVPVKEAKVDAGKSPEEKEKVRNVRKFGVSHNVAGHGKLRRSLHKMNRGDKKIPGDKSAWVEMEAYRVLASSDGQEKPSQFSYKDEKTAKKYADSIKKGGGKATVVKEDIGSFREYRANVEASKKRQQDKQDNRKKKDDAYIERVRKGIKFYDKKGSGRMVQGRKVYDKK